MRAIQILRTVAYALVITGAIVWGIVGFFDYNIVSAMFGEASLLSRIIYALVGLAGVTLMAIPNQEECYCESTDKYYND